MIKSTKSNCSNCKFWTKPETGFGKESEIFGTCKRTPFAIEIMEWNDDYSSDQIKKEYDYATAAVQDGSGYFACLITTLNHYCSMWSEKKWK